MTQSAARKRIREHIIALYAGGASYRHIAREHYPGVAHAWIGRIANDNHWPKSREILKLLGVLEVDESQQYARKYKKTIERLLKELRS